MPGNKTPLKIVILNECFLRDEHLQRLAKFGIVETYKDTDSEEKAIQRLQGADAAVIDCFLCPTSKNVFQASSKLRYICLNSVGYDPFDLNGARELAIQVSNVPGYSSQAVAEMALALMFTTVRKIKQMDRLMREKPFEADPSDESKRYLLGFDLSGKTLGLVGLGDIESRVAKMAVGIGMNVVGYNRSPKYVPGVREVGLDELMQISDVVSLHLPLNEQSEGIIGERQLAMMKPHAVLINTSRGKVVDETALIKALQEGKIAGAGLDVLANYDQGNPLIQMDNVVLTPHTAWFTYESFENLANLVVANMESWTRGEPVNLIY